MTKLEQLLNSLLALNLSITSRSSVTKTLILSGTLTGLGDIPCKAVNLLNTVSLKIGGGDTITTYVGGIIPCSNANEVQVSGAGTLGYIIYK